MIESSLELPRTYERTPSTRLDRLLSHHGARGPPVPAAPGTALLVPVPVGGPPAQVRLPAAPHLPVRLRPRQRGRRPHPLREHQPGLAGRRTQAGKEHMYQIEIRTVQDAECFFNVGLRYPQEA